jgi:hypothetical protein
MKNKMSLDTSYVEDYQLLAIASPLKDYTLAFFINKQLNLSLKKYDDLTVSDKGNAYSWYYFKQGKKYMSYFLIGNNHPKQKLITRLKDFDYFFLLKDASDKEQLQQMAAGMRSIQNVVGVFEQNMSTINGMDILIESNEFHEMQQIISPEKKSKNKM